MAKKTNSVRTLSDHWSPPSDLISDGVGEPVACFASTFEFDAAFFETELLPCFLGLKFDHTENERTFLIEREEKLALTSTAVLVDTHKVDPGQTTLRWDQIPIAVRGSQSIQHSKIVLLVWENVIRLIIGSANLPRPGYRRNREVFAALDFFNAPESVPRRPLEDAIELLAQILTWSRVPVATRDRTRDSLSLIRSKLASWERIGEDFLPRAKPKVRFIATRPAINRSPPVSAIDQVTTLWGSERVNDITVCTPFVGKPDGDGDKVVRQLEKIPRSRDCQGWLIAPRRASDDSDPKVRIALPQTFGHAWDQVFHSRGGTKVLAIPEFVQDSDKVKRITESKTTGADRRLRSPQPNVVASTANLLATRPDAKNSVP